MTFEPLLFNLEISVGFVLYNLVPTFIVFAILNVFGILVVYIAQIRGKLVQLLNENIKLLDRMHEGLMVISEKDLCLQFANRPAIAVLKQLPLTEALEKDNQLINPKVTPPPFPIDLTDLEKPIFKSSKVSVKGLNTSNNDS